MCLLMSGTAHALEPAQSRASTSSLPALSLPAFLDDKRVPDLHEAWQAQVQPAPQQEPQVVDGNAPVAPAANDASMSAARAAMQRAANGEAANVRQRAEELSRRFGAGDAASEPVGSIDRPSAAAAATAGTPPTPEVKQVIVPPLDTGAGAKTVDAKAVDAKAVDAKAAALGTSARPKSPAIDVSQKLRLAAPPPARKVPPNPVRAPRDTASITEPPSKVGGPVARPVPARKSSSKADVTGDILPTGLRSFGWDTQPD
jgi:hypothetical protein